jgi:uncharacterized protein YdcH (DUF465 family)
MNIQDEVQKIHNHYGTSEKANYEIQKLFDNQILLYKRKSDKWNELDEKIARCYVDENGEELSEEEVENIDLGTIGEIAAGAFGYL